MPYVLPGDEGLVENPSSWSLTSRGAENAEDVTAIAMSLAHPVIWAVFFPPMCTHLGWHSVGTAGLLGSPVPILAHSLSMAWGPDRNIWGLRGIQFL